VGLLRRRGRRRGNRVYPGKEPRRRCQGAHLSSLLPCAVVEREALTLYSLFRPPASSTSSIRPFPRWLKLATASTPTSRLGRANTASASTLRSSSKALPLSFPVRFSFPLPSPFPVSYARSLSSRLDVAPTLLTFRTYSHSLFLWQPRPLCDSYRCASILSNPCLPSH
jgi:hypothetical protein